MFVHGVLGEPANRVVLCAPHETHNTASDMSNAQDWRGLVYPDRVIIENPPARPWIARITGYRLTDRNRNDFEREFVRSVVDKDTNTHTFVIRSPGLYQLCVGKSKHIRRFPEKAIVKHSDAMDEAMTM